MAEADAPRRPRGRPRAFHDKTAQNTVQSLDRAMRVLTDLSQRDGATLTGLSEAMGEAPATLYRVLITLQGHGIVELDEAAQTWHVGPGAFRIGSAFLRRTNIVERSRPIMRDLMEATGETANLGVEQADLVLFVSQVETQASIRAFFPPGTQARMHASGIGKALLSRYPPDRVARVVAAKGLPGYTPRTLTEAGALAADLAQARARGYAVDDEERTTGMRCIAAPVFNALGEPVAGLSISGPSGRIGADRIAEIAAHVTQAAGRLSTALGGGDAPDPTAPPDQA